MLITLTPGDTGRREEVALQFQEVAPTDSRGGLHHVCDVVLYSMWHSDPFRNRRTLARLWDTSSSSRHQVTCSAGHWYDHAINKSNNTEDMSTGDTGVQEFRSTGVQEYQMSGNYKTIMPSPCKSDNHNMPCNIGVRCNSIWSVC